MGLIYYLVELLASLARQIRRPVGLLVRYFRSLAHLGELRQRVDDLEAANAQLRTVVEEAGGLLPPPPHLQKRVVGHYTKDFLVGGQAVVHDMENVLSKGGKSLASFNSVLDFGCGCGRVIRYLRKHVGPDHVLWGTDIDPEAISWCQANYRQIAEFEVNPHEPPLAFEENHFDLIYSVSIFTHLPEDLQHAWLAELGRIVKPGGYLILTVHGPQHFQLIPRIRRSEIKRIGFVYVDAGGTEGLPQFYQTAFHAPEYIHAVWSQYFEISGIHPLAISNHQDAILCRKPESN